jgi:hypothetical protein
MTHCYYRLYLYTILPKRYLEYNYRNVYLIFQQDTITSDGIGRSSRQISTPYSQNLIIQSVGDQSTNESLL